MRQFSHHRRSIRLKGYDYRRIGAYFVTFCIQNRLPLLGTIADGKMILNDAGNMVKTVWTEISTHYPGFKIDEYVVMPNHFHGIIEIVDTEGQPRGVAPTNPGVAPTNPETAPTNPGITPTNPGITPTNPGITPMNPVGAGPRACPCPIGNGKPNENPPFQKGQPQGVAPTNPGVAPTNPGVAPTNPGVAPTNPGVAPTNPGVAPTNPGVAPTNPGVAPTNPGVAPTNRGVAPTNRGVAPTNRGVAPTNPGVAPTNPRITPTTPNGKRSTLSLPDIVHRFKTMTTKRYTDGVKQNGWPPFPKRLWQRNYYEHIVRNDDDYNRIREYIINNPINWMKDQNNPMASGFCNCQKNNVVET